MHTSHCASSEGPFSDLGDHSLSGTLSEWLGTTEAWLFGLYWARAMPLGRTICLRVSTRSLPFPPVTVVMGVCRALGWQPCNLSWARLPLSWVNPTSRHWWHHSEPGCSDAFAVSCPPPTLNVWTVNCVFERDTLSASCDAWAVFKTSLNQL